MRYVRHVEDEDGNLVGVLYYCCRLCFSEEPDPAIRDLAGGWWPCLDSELESAEPCRVCGEPIGPGTSKTVSVTEAANQRVGALDRRARR